MGMTDAAFADFAGLMRVQADAAREAPNVIPMGTYLALEAVAAAAEMALRDAARDAQSDPGDEDDAMHVGGDGIS
jgi:hypothetical protein